MFMHNASSLLGGQGSRNFRVVRVVAVPLTSLDVASTIRVNAFHFPPSPPPDSTVVLPFSRDGANEGVSNLTRSIRELSTRLPPRAANLAKTISMNTDDRWDGSIAVPGARLYKRRLKSTKERIRITKVLPTPGPLFPIVLIGIHGVRGRPFYQYHIIPDAIMSYRAIVSQEAYRQPLNAPLPLSPPFNVSLSHSLLPFNRSIIDQLGKRERGKKPC